MQTVAEPIPIRIGCRTDVGHKREHNEDSFAVVDRAALNGLLDCVLLVADGMGGMGGGDVASRITAHTVPETIHQLLQTSPHEELVSLLLQAFQAANQEVFTRRADRIEQRSMGTTCVCALIRNGTLAIAHVGDSRAYLLRHGRLSLLTADHSAVWEEIQAGRMTREEAEANRYRHVITRAIGIAPDVEVDTSLHSLEVGDVLLLCSDGLTTEVTEREIAQILVSSTDPQEACNRLIESALNHGGSDNVTALVARYGPMRPLLPPEEETPTDNTANWRYALTQETVADSKPVSKVARGWVVGTLLLLLIALGEAAWIYHLFVKLQHARPSQPVVLLQPPSKPAVFEPLSYATVATKQLDMPLRNDVLQIMPNGDLLVATLQGKLMDFNPQTHLLRPVPVNAQIPSSPETSAKKTKPTAHFYLTLDQAGNRYQIRPDLRCIEKFTPEGTRVATNIGKGALVAPTCLAVAPSGTIYVIDNGRLKSIQAYPARPQSSELSTSQAR
ncbi:Stp1/IreP family PP2C-type Ser/Thr phosphatase [Chthonomonas calidirosea]|uniref:Stp1/IreP family PP2C-type Ser/Thr phosphatase n=1 Tax=Chthonomonas calidirosea TaxID=454171 RepID=UPI0006EC9500|nr:Stp1/IreP family PP2C-type Ser/Thr phosphatase [Chthonomonas calidirosea]CEK12537.1 serine/threonine protein phosphatase [Chthonomonas calidirosea]